ncbi:MAG: hypothetical protein AABY27_07055, partial [Pseudomonadota bacterium]
VDAVTQVAGQNLKNNKQKTEPTPVPVEAKQNPKAKRSWAQMIMDPLDIAGTKTKLDQALNEASASHDKSGGALNKAQTHAAKAKENNNKTQGIFNR